MDSFFLAEKIKTGSLGTIVSLDLEHGPHPLGDEWSPPGNDGPPLLPGHGPLGQGPEAEAEALNPSPTWDPLGSLISPVLTPPPQSIFGCAVSSARPNLPNWSGYIAKPQM